MTRYKHVLILIILVLPMFVLAPTLVASPTEVLSNRVEIETSLPAQFVEETLRVAVYAEDNTSLPAYASGGVTTAHHPNLIQFLDANGYAVTPISTDDITDGRLMTGDFDVFVLPNNLPKDGIVDLVMDYWLGGGGILSFDSGLGFLYYHGMIVPEDTGNYGLLHVDVDEHWGFGYIENITVGARHSTAKDYQVDDIIVAQENITIHDRFHFSDANVEDFNPLLIEEGGFSTTAGFALDNTARQGGRIVQLPGNCSVIPAWEKSIIIDSIDWLAPRPKGRILIDLTHDPWIPIDSWDPYHEFYPLNQYRNGLVNHSYTLDKLHTDLTLDNLEAYDMLVILAPGTNFTSQEVQDVQNWVSNGGGLFVFGETQILGNIAADCDYLLSPYDISFNLTDAGSLFDSIATPAGEHPLHEGASQMEYDASAYLNITGDAYPLWMYGANIVAAGQDYGAGRIIVSGDTNLAADGLAIHEQENYYYLMQVANWLTASTARILVYADTSLNPLHPNLVPINGPVAQALNDLGESFYMTSVIEYFNLSLFSENWDMVVFDNNMDSTLLYQPHLIDFVEGGGKVIFNTWDLNSETGDYFGVDYAGEYTMPPSVYLWDTGHPIFNKPVAYAATTVNTTLNIYGTEALNLTTYANATPLAGYADGGVAIALGAGGNVIFNGPTFVIYNEDTDNSTYPDNVELWTNQIAFLYYDRPIVNHPDDVTYMETETGNEISWMPVADAGPWEYVVRENGSIVEAGHWNGEAITINVDGVNVSITDYQLTVFDRLGYSASDVVVLNVTEYVAPTTTDPGGPGAPLDPTLLLIIGAAAAGVVIILILVMQLKKKK